MHLRHLSFFVLFFSLLGSLLHSADRPNIVFILADDLGITDIAAYARHFTGTPTEELYYETPHMDRLVERGIAFSQYYANQLCSPTRAALMTGQYPARHGFTTATPRRRTYYNQGMTPPAGNRLHDVLEHKDPIKEEQAWINGKTNTALDPTLPTLPKVLKTHRSVFIGKWHLGGHGAAGFQPMDHGFDEALAWFDAGGSYYFNRTERESLSWVSHWNNREKPYPEMPQPEYTVGNAGPPPHADYLTDDLTDRAVAYIHRAVEEQESGEDERPFFLYFNHFAVHTPLQAPPETVAQYFDKPQKGTLGHDNATYAAMVRHLDDSVGRIVAALEASGQRENTVIILTSDNGGVEYTNPPATDNFPFKGGKACLYEGGVRVPLVYWQPGTFEGGQWCDTPTNCIDQLPTLAALTNNPPPSGIDGISLAPLLENPRLETEPRNFFWHYPFNVIVKHPDNGLPLTPHSAIRQGDYKLIWDWHGKLELYDVPNDPYESKDLSTALPEKRDALFAQLRRWIAHTVDAQYLPVLNPDYDPSADKRPYPFANLAESVIEKKMEAQREAP